MSSLYPKPNLSRPAPGHEIYPYLLRGVSIERPNQAWTNHITYLPMHGGFLYQRPLQFVGVVTKEYIQSGVNPKTETAS